ncbi:uncharacterized protein HD556DRAFT_1431856 [Suillus plorans]|uniref:CxC2-like cysteine cluster KDZ transposase-associated domain-containing protein n=1 Tax=Suillus plorans TaxID=116603 RepID=A0A9P7ARN2_9AGAM|nr:uncharacterized protein HD556DRAFT_1431856 [Suillus plorans]KAG1794837.1 hypothetical protein HD556DRAFT_1431856 [Suillus plorans]
MKRCGQGHHPGGIEETEAGACAVLCPACPHPSKNLPVGWENTPPEFHYRFLVANAQEVMNLADTRASHGLAATGAGTIDCARHNFKCPCSVGDLQKGERYINMDYLFFSSMRSSRDVHVLNISYDIACQWNKNLWSRMSAFPHKYHINHDEKVITFFMPKFHLPVHITSCQTKFSFNFIKGVG